MNELFLVTLNSIALALLKIFLIAFLGALLVRRKIFTSKDIVSFSALMVQIKNWGGDEQQTGSMMLIAYSFCIIAIPVWMSVWKIL